MIAMPRAASGGQEMRHQPAARRLRHEFSLDHATQQLRRAERPGSQLRAAARRRRKAERQTKAADGWRNSLPLQIHARPIRAHRRERRAVRKDLDIEGEIGKLAGDSPAVQPVFVDFLNSARNGRRQFGIQRDHHAVVAHQLVAMTAPVEQEQVRFARGNPRQQSAQRQMEAEGLRSGRLERQIAARHVEFERHIKPAVETQHRRFTGNPQRRIEDPAPNTVQANMLDRAERLERRMADCGKREGQRRQPVGRGRDPRFRRKLALHRRDQLERAGAKTRLGQVRPRVIRAKRQLGAVPQSDDRGRRRLGAA
jgi:hypothetical protein